MWLDVFLLFHLYKGPRAWKEEQVCPLQSRTGVPGSVLQSSTFEEKIEADNGWKGFRLQASKTRTLSNTTVASVLRLTFKRRGAPTVYIQQRAHVTQKVSTAQASLQRCHDGSHLHIHQLRFDLLYPGRGSFQGRKAWPVRVARFHLLLALLQVLRPRLERDRSVLVGDVAKLAVPLLSGPQDLL